MISQVFEYLLNNIIEMAFMLLLGLIVGSIIIYSYMNRQVRIQNSTISDLQESIQEKDIDVKKLHLAQEIMKNQFSDKTYLIKMLEENKRDRQVLSEKIYGEVTELENKHVLQIGTHEEKTRRIQSELNEKNESINLLNLKIRNLEEKNQESQSLVDQLRTSLFETEDTEQRYKEKIEFLELDNRGLIYQLSEKNGKYSSLETKNEELSENYQASLMYIDQLRDSLSKTQLLVEAEEAQISLLSNRMRFMHDDFKHIFGIGPKLSALLQNAGIDNFKKLGSLNLDKLTGILITENPNLIHLVDPSTWPEQALLASEGNIVELSAFKEKVKEKSSISAETIYILKNQVSLSTSELVN